MKKFFAILLSAMLMLSLAVPAMADDVTTYKITINNTTSGHTYEAYQIFTGDLSAGVLSNIKWGSSVSNSGALGDAAKIAERLDTSYTGDDKMSIDDLLNMITLGSKVADSGSSSNPYVISDLAAGYYLVKDADNTLDGDYDAYTDYIIKVVANVTATPKADVPEVEKAVNDNDINIGDTVTFTLTATLPTYYFDSYESYTAIFHDTMSAGLTFGEISEVTVNGKELEVTDYSFDKNPITDDPDTAEVVESGTALTITIDDVKDYNAVAGSSVIVKYTATLNSDAVIGTEGNPNEVYLEYSNDPNWDGEGDEPTGDTPEKEVKVYTWEIPVFKYTGTDDPLAGAGFTLHKGESVIKLVADGATEAGVPVYKVCTLTDCDHNGTEVDGDGHVTEIITGETGKFEIEGLEQGTYTLKETTTPAGYNDCEDITVVIGENGALTQNSSAVNEVKILNQSGATLPETGGMGTTIFYIVGGIMVVGAVVLLITKKRMSAEG